MSRCPPPPPPPPGPAPPSRTGPAVAKANGSTPRAATSDRSALLGQIHQGAKLKKAVTNDRSAPIIEGAKSNSSPGGMKTAAIPPSTGRNNQPGTGSMGRQNRSPSGIKPTPSVAGPKGPSTINRSPAPGKPTPSPLNGPTNGHARPPTQPIIKSTPQAPVNKNTPSPPSKNPTGKASVGLVAGNAPSPPPPVPKAINRPPVSITNGGPQAHANKNATVPRTTSVQAPPAPTRGPPAPIQKSAPPPPSTRAPPLTGGNRGPPPPPGRR